MKKQFYMGFWNYLNAGSRDPELLAEEWQDLGMNLAMSSFYDPDKCSFNMFNKELLSAKEKGISVILCDKRAHWTSLRDGNEQSYRKGIIEIKNDLAGDNSVIALNICDEPTTDEIPKVIKAAIIVREILPDKFAYINFFPYWGADFFDKMHVLGKDYSNFIADVCLKTGMPIVSYDCYRQCAIYNTEAGLDLYFQNLNLFKKAAEKIGIPLWTSLLSVGHWDFRVPTADDFRWQLSTAAAHGCTGVVWFYIYARFKVPSFRESPFDEFFEKTQTYYALRREIKIFMKYFGDYLAMSKLIKVEHFGQCYGGTEGFQCDKYIDSIECRTNTALIISRFLTQEGKIAVMIVNNSQKLPANICVRSSYFYMKSGGKQSYWLSPGEAVWLN